MKSLMFFCLLTILFGMAPPSVEVNYDQGKVVKDKWQPFKTQNEGGLLGERVDLWRTKRLWYVGNSDFLLSGFESRPGAHLWQGEHVGKWIHAATLAYEETKDEKIKIVLDNTVKRLLATQLPDGYMGTYSEDKRYYNSPTDPIGWDIWTERYNLYGLLVYEQYHPNKQVIDACKKIGDKLIETYGRGKTDITKYGTRKGISSTTVLESIVMLYERTHEKKYLDFAEQIVSSSENNPGLRLMSAMLKNESVIYPGDGKAYQLMANLLGYLRLYKVTGNDKYLQTVTTAWEQIKSRHVLTTGGPWTRKTDYNGNKECFAKTGAFNPEQIVVENCVSVTWIQLNLQLADLTGQAKYPQEAEKTLFNQLFGGQHSEGIDWCYYTKPNEIKPPYVSELHCCASSGPRALEMFTQRLAGGVGNSLSLNYLSPSTISLPQQFGGGNLDVVSNFPFGQSAEIIFEIDKAKSFPLEFRIPYGSTLNQIRLNGKSISATKNARGYFQVENNWSKGDKLSLTMDYKVQMHVQEGENKKKWISFSYGPLSLAQKISEKQADEPFKDFRVGPESSTLVNLVSKSSQSGSDLTFKIKGSAVTLIPYYQAGSRTSGPRTYFETAL